MSNSRDSPRYSTRYTVAKNDPSPSTKDSHHQDSHQDRHHQDRHYQDRHHQDSHHHDSHHQDSHHHDSHHQDSHRSRIKKRKSTTKTDNSSETSDSNTSPERETKKQKHKRKDKGKKDKKKDKKDKKDKKERKEKKEKKLTKYQEAVEYLNSVGQANIGPQDYYKKNTEFIEWLREAQSMLFEDLPNKETTLKYFSRFTDLWNSGKLPEKYYKGIKPDELVASTRTRYRWKFVDNLNANDTLILGTACDSISKDTHKKQAKDLFKLPVPENQTGPRHKQLMNQKPSESDDQDVDEEEKRRNLMLQKKQENLQFRKHKEMVEEELVPKATGREALIEKKKMKREIARQADDSPERSDADLIGGGNDYQYLLAQKRKREEKRDAARKQQQLERLQQYQEKEEKTLSMFRDLVKAGNFPLLQQRPNQT